MIFQIRRTYDRDMSIYEGRLKQAGFNLNTVVEREDGYTWYEHRVEINSIEEYFTHIQELAQEDRRYTMLPLDEEVFEIDANKIAEWATEGVELLSKNKIIQGNEHKLFNPESYVTRAETASIVTRFIYFSIS